jgi:hypothetical protein
MAMVRMKRGHAPDMPIGSERWNVQERRNYWDSKIQDVKDTELGKINRFSDFTHLTGGQLKERISFYMVCSARLYTLYTPSIAPLVSCKRTYICVCGCLCVCQARFL